MTISAPHLGANHGGAYLYTNGRQGSCGIRDTQVHSGVQPTAFIGTQCKRMYEGADTGPSIQHLDSKVISQNQMKMNMTLEDNAMKASRRRKHLDKTYHEASTTSMSDFKDLSYNPMTAPRVVSSERLTFLQGLTPPPENIRNPRLEAYDKAQKLVKAGRRRSRSSAGSRISGGSRASMRSAALSELIESNSDMYAGLKKIKERLRASNKQLDGSASRPYKDNGDANPYTTYNSARGDAKSDADDRSESRSQASWMTGTTAQGTLTSRSNFSQFTGISGVSKRSRSTNALSINNYPAAYGIYT